MKPDIDVEKIKRLRERAALYFKTDIDKYPDEPLIESEKLLLEALSLLPPVCSECGGSGVCGEPDELGGDICTCYPCPACQPAAGEVEEFVKKSGDFWLGGQPKTNAERALTIRLDTACDHLTTQAKQIKELNKDHTKEIFKLNDICVAKTRKLQAKIEELEGEKKGLKEALQKYGEHEALCCKGLTDGKGKCNCGLDQALQKGGE